MHEIEVIPRLQKVCDAGDSLQRVDDDNNDWMSHCRTMDPSTGFAGAIDLTAVSRCNYNRDYSIRIDLWNVQLSSISKTGPLPSIPFHAKEPALPLLRLPSLEPCLHLLSALPATYIDRGDHPSDVQPTAEHSQFPE